MPSHLTVLFSELAARPERALRRPRSGEGAGFQNVAHAAGPAVIDGANGSAGAAMSLRLLHLTIQHVLCAHSP